MRHFFHSVFYAAGASSILIMTAILILILLGEPHICVDEDIPLIAMFEVVLGFVSGSFLLYQTSQAMRRHFEVKDNK